MNKKTIKHAKKRKKTRKEKKIEEVWERCKFLSAESSVRSVVLLHLALEKLMKWIIDHLSYW